MQKLIIISGLIFMVAMSVAFTGNRDSLRKLYSRSPSKWPAPSVDPGVKWVELGALPQGPIVADSDSLADEVFLGKILFFDPRLSGSGKISCGTCHKPELWWADGRKRALGHEDQENKRNSPSLQNVWFYKRLFWDGRARDLEDQAFAPINSESEMHGDMRELPANLRKIKGYEPLFRAAFGDSRIDPDRIASALANFQRTISSGKTRFDEFVKGKYGRLSDGEIRGLHLFRTKGKCMNCHNGPLFSDNEFHHAGFGGTADEGRYFTTHKEDDRGRFRTPSLRDVVNTGPWMHDGSERSLKTIINTYSKGTGKDQLLRPLRLSESETVDLLSFLRTISAPPIEFVKPSLPE
jgi:cytochrome c peroxidase